MIEWVIMHCCEADNRLEKLISTEYLDLSIIYILTKCVNYMTCKHFCSNILNESTEEYRWLHKFIVTKHFCVSVFTFLYHYSTDIAKFELLHFCDTFNHWVSIHSSLFFH